MSNKRWYRLTALSLILIFLISTSAQALGWQGAGEQRDKRSEGQGFAPAVPIRDGPPPMDPLIDANCPDPQAPCGREEPPTPSQGRRPSDERWYVPASTSSHDIAASASPQDTGGPDGFGYTWDDSVAFNWIDARSLGTNSGLYGGDEYTGPVDMGFTFPFYENSYNQLYFSTKGLISFEQGSFVWGNTALPNPAPPNNIIVPFWDDLGMYSGSRPDSGIYTYQGGTAPNRYFVVEWYRAD